MLQLQTVRSRWCNDSAWSLTSRSANVSILLEHGVDLWLAVRVFYVTSCCNAKRTIVTCVPSSQLPLVWRPGMTAPAQDLLAMSSNVVF